MLGDYPVEFFVWVLMTPVILAAIVGLIVGLGFAVLMALTALNHGLAALVRRTVDGVKARRALRSAGARSDVPGPL